MAVSPSVSIGAATVLTLFIWIRCSIAPLSHLKHLSHPFFESFQLWYGLEAVPEFNGRIAMNGRVLHMMSKRICSLHSKLFLLVMSGNRLVFFMIWLTACQTCELLRCLFPTEAKVAAGHTFACACHLLQILIIWDIVGNIYITAHFQLACLYSATQ